MVVIKCVEDNKKASCQLAGEQSSYPKGTAVSELPDKYLGFHQDLNACVDNFKECVALMRSNMRRKQHRENGLTPKDKAYYVPFGDEQSSPT